MNAIAIQSAVDVNKPLTLNQIKQMLKFANNSNLEKPLVLGLTVRGQDIDNPDQMKRTIAQHLFDSLTDRTEDDGSVIVGNHRITYVGVTEYTILKSTPTLFQRVEIIVEAKIFVEQEKI